MNLNFRNPDRKLVFSTLEIFIIIGLACVPLFSSFPYRVNIFLSWEGAYRLSEGQIPYKDFGMPLGYMFWVVPALFFKLFGAQMITLIKAQVFINIMSGLAFRSILKSLSIPPGIRLLSVLLYCLSYSFFNFWPWYNHTVIVYEMVAIAFLLFYMFRSSGQLKWIWLCLSSLFLFFSFFTKQDGGGLALMICGSLVCAHCILEKKWKPLILFCGSLVLIGFAFILPLTNYNFGYWFNHGQPPHTSRVTLFDIVDEFFYRSEWIKFYITLVLILAFAQYRHDRGLLKNKREVILLLLVLGILAEAAIIQVTSYTPPDNNIFFHSFAFAYILYQFSRLLQLDFSGARLLLLTAICMVVWWSSTYWKYAQRIMARITPAEKTQVVGGENLVNRKTFMISKDTGLIPMNEWVYSGLKSFEKIYMPKPTVEGIHRLLNQEVVKNNKNLKVLNMTELTPLAREIPYELERGPEVPLWYHLGVSMFNKDAARFEQKIAARYYDLVLFEYVPGLNNFYPFRVRDSLMNHYQKIDSFYAPRSGATKGTIEVYVKPK